ncbi:hypothetical protein ACDQ55_17430 [Chitinophaga sp. 30R24]|uniref:hypothetical protein n=1 Tax=Chitinophaga sp. 30R24 TaxID=3248838 RepID=UPI003B8ED0E3
MIITDTLLSIFFAPLVFLLDFKMVVIGMVLWGLGMGIQGSALRAAVAGLVAPNKRGADTGYVNV